MSRKSINITDNTETVTLLLAEGNPGGLTILARILESRGLVGFDTLLHLDDMNIRGSQIWIGYKDYCKEDLNKFVEAVKRRDPEMVKLINDLDDGDEVAVIRSASFNRS